MAKEPKNVDSKIGITQFVGGILIVFTIFMVFQWYGLIGTTSTSSFEFFSIFSSTKSQASNDESKINLSEYNPDEKYVFKLEEKSIYNDTDYISQVYEMKGDIRINKNFSEVLFVATNSEEEKPLPYLKTLNWIVKPYSHKIKLVMKFVKDVSIKILKNSENAPACSVNHNSTPAIVFSNGGYCGNFYHDTNDVLVPLFLTSYQFNGEVQFVVNQKQWYWFKKYRKIISKLSNYDIIDLDNEEEIHCYNHVIVGLHSHDDFKIDANINFRKFFRNAYGLEREFPIQIRNNNQQKPRVLLVERTKDRNLTNTVEIISMISGLGFEVLLNDLIRHDDASESSKIVNSCDIMIGVHGAGLTNMMFLPNNAILIQIVPLGNANGIFSNTYKMPALNMELKYLQYDISEEESTLIYRYRRNESVFTDFESIHDQGWAEADRIYLREQNITINATRFRPVLEEAMKLLYA